MPKPGKRFPVFHVRLRTFKDLCFDATHWYAEVFSADGRPIRELTHKLTEREAALLNKADGVVGETRAKPGDESTRFFSREQAVGAAQSWIMTQGHHTETGMANGLHAFLFVGNPASADPQEILAGPSPIYDVARQLFLEAQANDFWRGSDERMRDVCARWDEFVSCWFAPVGPSVAMGA